MLDVGFLKSLGIRAELLPSKPNPQNPPPEDAGTNLELPIAGNNGFPAELLNLDAEEPKKLLKEQHSHENPYVFLMPNGIHQVAVYPETILQKYDLEFTAKEFITFIALVGKGKIDAYKTREGQWYYMPFN